MLRIKADKAYNTIKGAGDSAPSRREYECEIPLTDGEELLNTLPPKEQKKPVTEFLPAS